LVLPQSKTLANPEDLVFTSPNDLQGWTSGFADLPVAYEPSIYELKVDRASALVTEVRKPLASAMGRMSIVGSPAAKTLLG
jgi:hypothetical protein